MFRPHVITAIASRNIKTFFTNVTGYLFIVCFVVISGIIAFSPKFFADNLATLDQLTNAYPMLLMFLIPAFTMGIWADERRQGTDAILFTLPASDFEILLGKFVSVVVVYLAALFFSLAQLIALAMIGAPDWGVILSTYVGYFLAGMALLSIGMFASSLTSNTTVAFVLGATLCAIPVFVGAVAPSSQFLQSLSIEWQLREFGQGSIALSNVLYFVALKKIGLFLNYVVISKRHWATDQETKLYWLYGGQVLSILVIAGSLYAISVKMGSYYDTEIDMTSQRVNTLSETSLKIINEASNKRRVYIQAYVSEEVPTEFVAVKKRLLRLLRQYSQMGGENIELRIVNIAANSKQAKEATNAGIKKIDHRSEVGGREIRQDVYLGLKFSSSIGEAVIPKIDTETPLEYELTRALGTTGVRQKKLRLGVLDSHASYLGMQIPGAPVSYEFNHMVVDKLKQRYELVRVSEADLTKMIEQQRKAAKESGNDTKKSEDDSPKEKAEADPAKKDEDSKDSDSKDADSKQKDESKDEKAEEDEPAIIVPDVLLVVRPSRVSNEVQKQLVEYMTFGNPTVFMLDPLPIYPFTVFNGDGSIPESPKQRVAAGPRGLFLEDEENNDCSTLFDALQVNWFGEKQSVTFPAVPGRPNQFGQPMGGRPERTADAFFPAFVSQVYRPFDELRFDDLTLSFRIGDDVRETGMNLTDERDGIPTSLGSPNALMINSLKHGDFDPFNRDSQMTSGVNNVLMFYAGVIRPQNKEELDAVKQKKEAAKQAAEQQKKIREMMAKANPDSPPVEDSDDDATQDEITKIDFIPLISVEENAIGVSWDDITNTEKETLPGFPPQEVERILIDSNPNFYAYDLKLEDLDKQIEKAKEESNQEVVDKLTEEKKTLIEIRSRASIKSACLAAHLKGETKNGNEVNAVVLTDADFASNLYGSIEQVLNKKPDNVEFLLNIVDSLGGREEFVALRGRNPEQRTLTYMDKKRDEFSSSRLGKEQQMKRDMRKEVVRISQELEKQNEESDETGIAKFFMQAEGVMKANEKIEIEERKLQDKLDEDIAGLKADEARNLKETESWVRITAIIFPCLPALFLGIFVLIFRYVQERSFVR